MKRKIKFLKFRVQYLKGRDLLSLKIFLKRTFNKRISV